MEVVEFPGLWGLKLNISRAAFNLFGNDIYWYGIIIASGMLLSMFLALRSCEKFGLTRDDITDMLIFGVPSAIIFARLYYVLFKWEEFRCDFFAIINIRSGGLAIYGGVIGAILSVFIFTKVRKIPTLKLFDFAAVYLPLGQAIGRWGNFFNQEAYGVNTTLPWGMKSESISRELESMKKAGLDSVNWVIDPNLPVHPTFLYESLWNIGLFLLLLFMRKRKKFEGEIFALYMALYGLGRFFIEGIRTDSLMFGSLRVSQILAMLFFIVFLTFVLIKRKSAAKAQEI